MLRMFISLVAFAPSCAGPGSASSATRPLTTLFASQATVAREWRIAIHEAGHCVAARLMRLPRCGGATIIEPHARAAFPTNCGPASICALLAGGIAETIMLGDYDRGGSKCDWERARERLERCGYADGGGALWVYTINLLCPHLSLLKRVAIKLRRAPVPAQSGTSGQ
jgi:hypothetical protein